VPSLDDTHGVDPGAQRRGFHPDRAAILEALDLERTHLIDKRVEVHVPEGAEGNDDKNRRHGSRNGDVVEEFDGVRLRRERNKTLLFRLPSPTTPKKRGHK
jgi:hypothetical protein